MTFKGHLSGGIVAGITLTGLAVRWGYIPGADYRVWAAVCGATVFFSLFPDLDTASVPQRWFFRGVFMALVYLGWNERYDWRESLKTFDPNDPSPPKPDTPYS